MIKLDVSKITPDAKDFERADGLRYRPGTKEFRDYPWDTAASTMAKAIKDPEKLVRRALAVVATYGCNKGPDDAWAWKAFYTAMFEMGFTVDQVRTVGSLGLRIKRDVV